MRNHSFFYRNGLSLTIFGLFIISFAGQIFYGWKEYNEQLYEFGVASVPLLKYFRSGHFIESTFENWESEFLQMACYVYLTIFLRQAGSAESKSLEEKEEVDREPQPSPDAPWAVRKGGWVLTLYKNSLTVSFLLLFLISLILHFVGSYKDYNEQQFFEGKAKDTVLQYLQSSRFWFESFQNWQSEFLSVLAIVLLSIFLRQKGSPESKPVDAPHSETGK